MRRSGAEEYEVTLASSYGDAIAERGHPTDAAIVLLAGAVATGVRLGGVAPAALLACALVPLIWWRWRSALLVLLVASSCIAGAVRSGQAWAELAPDQLGPYVGWVRVVDDPQPLHASTRVVVEVAGERFELWARGRARQLRVRSWRGGQWITMSGQRVSLDPTRAHRVAWQHVVGEFRLEWASDVHEGGPVARASNRVRRAVERAAATMPADDGALFRGLVVGDDRDQPPAMIARFRASGLSHLTAVSGQNVSFVLAACGPLLRRLRTWPRLVVTIALIAWFVTLTRFEPSIIRAGTMAGLSAVAYATGRERAPLRTLAIAVAGLVLVDPLLVWSIGFWLSVGATFGVTTVGPWLARRCARLGPLALPVGVTLGAQVGVAAPAILVFGRLPLVSIPANLLAVPVAGAVMLVGLPAGLVAGWVPAVGGPLMLPVRVGTRWVDTVALLGARLEPEPPWSWVGWVAIGVAVAAVAARDGRRGKNQPRDDDASADR